MFKKALIIILFAVIGFYVGYGGAGEANSLVAIVFTGLGILIGILVSAIIGVLKSKNNEGANTKE